MRAPTIRLRSLRRTRGFRKGRSVKATRQHASNVTGWWTGRLEKTKPDQPDRVSVSVPGSKTEAVRRLLCNFALLLRQPLVTFPAPLGHRQALPSRVCNGFFAYPRIRRMP